jgi:hypothetical protein
MPREQQGKSQPSILTVLFILPFAPMIQPNSQRYVERLAEHFKVGAIGGCDGANWSGADDENRYHGRSK